jgi:hypothetical protein
MKIYDVEKLIKPRKIHVDYDDDKKKGYFIDNDNVGQTILVKFPVMFVLDTLTKNNLCEISLLSTNETLNNVLTTLDNNIFTNIKETLADEDIEVMKSVKKLSEQNDMTFINFFIKDKCKMFVNKDEPFVYNDISSLKQRYVQPIVAIWGFQLNENTKSYEIVYEIAQLRVLKNIKPTYELNEYAFD